MTLRGGYNVPVTGAPSPEVRDLPAPERLYLPLTSPRFEFSDVKVAEGQNVAPGEVLAVDPTHFSVPLLAPRAGTVRLDSVAGHVVLDGLDPGDSNRASGAPSRPSHGDAGDPAGSLPGRLLALGAWQFFAEARTREPVDPAATPSAMIATTLRLEPFLAGGEAQLEGAVERLARGLELLASTAPDAPLYVVVPDSDAPLAAEVRAVASRCAGARVVAVPLRFPFDDPALLARYLRLPSGPDDTVWSLPVEGILAVEAALSSGVRCTERVISVAGPAVAEPVHFKAVVGYPIEQIRRACGLSESLRLVNGGVLTGAALPPDQRGLDSECTGLTALAEPTRQTLISFARPGVSRRSYSRTFVGTLRTDMSMRYRAGLSGELRPCISCGQCADVCPAGILPAVIHKQLYAGKIEEAQRARVDLCVGCGLCSFVCPSKIDLRAELLAAAAELRREAAALRAEAAAAAAEAALAAAAAEETAGEATP